MKIDQYISGLLYRYDCVIIPGLGGFVCNYFPAKINAVRHSFFPPSRQVMFNSSLRSNDGLLANHISLEERLTFAEAGEVIKDFVLAVNNRLKNGEKVNIEEIGKLFLDKEENLQFEPDENANFLQDSFGLGILYSPPVRREGISKRIEREFKDRVLSKETRAKKKTSIRRIAALGILIPLIAVVTWVSFGTDFLKDGKFSSLNPFAVKESPLYHPGSKPPAVITEKNLTDHQAALSKKITTGITSIKLADDSKRSIVINLSDAAVTKPDSTSVKTPYNLRQQGHFYIIGGCFEIYDNATRFAASLKEKGYQASILGEKLGRLNPVSYGDYTSREAALDALLKIHTDNPHAWILAK